jgi:hypothetical protein
MEATMMTTLMVMAGLAGLILTACVAPSVARADLIFAVTVTGHPIVLDSAPVSDFNGCEPHGIESPCPGLTVFFAAGHAGRVLKGRVLASAQAPFSLSSRASAADVSVHVDIDDIFFFGPDPTVETSLVLPFDAIMLFIPDLVSNGEAGVVRQTIQVTAAGNFGSGSLELTLDSRTFDEIDLGVIAFGGNERHTITVGDTFLPPVTFIPSGSSFVTRVSPEIPILVSGALVLPRVTVPVGLPQRLVLNLNLHVDAVASDFAGAIGAFNAFDTFGVPQGVPVFDLPPGFTASSASLGLVDNVVGVPAASSVPLPASVVLVTLASLGVAVARARSGHYRRGRAPLS